jgi:hypothetical protein
MPRAKKEKQDFSNIKYEMGRTWDNIAADILGCTGGPNDETATMSRSSVIEVVLDQMYNVEYERVPAEEMAAWKALSSNQRKKVAREEFTYKTYGY